MPKHGKIIYDKSVVFYLKKHFFILNVQKNIVNFNKYLVEYCQLNIY